MDLFSLVEGPLLWAAFLIFLIGSILRVLLFVTESHKKDKIIYEHLKWGYVLNTIFRWVLPVNKDIAKNPVFTIVAYIFHICLIVVPIWFSGHISLWEESRFGWSWTALPDGVSDWMTVIFLMTAIFLLLRRIFSKDIRFISTPADYLLLIITVLPFATGYFLTHGTLDGVSFFSENMQLLHMISAELMLILIPFTKLSHYILFFFSRGSTAVEFGRREYYV